MKELKKFKNVCSDSDVSLNCDEVEQITRELPASESMNWIGAKRRLTITFSGGDESGQEVDGPVLRRQPSRWLKKLFIAVTKGWLSAAVHKCADI